jgi:hypothetical protein
MSAKDRICVGYRPKTGQPVDADGRLLLARQWAPAPKETQAAPEKPVNRRGAQGELL